MSSAARLDEVERSPGGAAGKPALTVRVFPAAGSGGVMLRCSNARVGATRRSISHSAGALRRSAWRQLAVQIFTFGASGGSVARGESAHGRGRRHAIRQTQTGLSANAAVARPCALLGLVVLVIARIKLGRGLIMCRCSDLLLIFGLRRCQHQLLQARRFRILFALRF
jgi:hypothetical protein